MASLKWIGLVLGISSLTACFGGSGHGNDDGGGSNCESLPGEWDIDGQCAATVCQLTQNGCSITLDCDDGSKFSGSVNGTKLSFSDADTKCSATIQYEPDDEPDANGTCEVDGDTCDFKAECQSGKCLTAGNDTSGAGGDGNTSSGGTSSTGGSVADGGFGAGGSSAGSSQGGSFSTGGTGAAGSGNAGSGGTGGSDLDPICELGTNAFCTCYEDASGTPCTSDDASIFYYGCVEDTAGYEPIACFATYVEGDSINCTDAVNACIPE